MTVPAKVNGVTVNLTQTGRPRQGTSREQRTRPTTGQVRTFEPQRVRPGTTTTLTVADGAVDWSVSDSREPGTWQPTNAAGEASVSGLTPGRYVLWVRDSAGVHRAGRLVVA